MSAKPLHFDTLQIHAGYDPEATTHASYLFIKPLHLFLKVPSMQPISLD